MNLNNYFWFFTSAVPIRLCDEIIKYSKSIQDQLATTGGYGDPKTLSQKQIKDLKKKRDSDIVWLLVPVGIFSGTFQRPVNLPNIRKDNIMIGIAMVGINRTREQMVTLLTERSESYL